MNAFDTAKKFFEACEKPLGWQACQQYVEPDAAFTCQSDALTNVTSVQSYCDWMYGFGTITSPEGHYTLHSSSYDEQTKTALFFATYHAKHTGEGGPVPPTQKSSDSHYVYAITMNDNDKVSKVIKIWNSPWAMAELGWC